MIRLTQAVVVEGRYDKIKLDGIIDGIIVTTDGFNLFQDTEKQALLRRLAEECGLIVLTDSDDAGFKIRKFISDITENRALHAYIPEQAGKERRKQRPGAAGLIGVEGMEPAVVEAAIRQALEPAQLQDMSPAQERRMITAADLFSDGLSGCAGAGTRRAALLRLAGLPTRLSTKAMLALLTRLYGYAGYQELLSRLADEQTENHNIKDSK